MGHGGAMSAPVPHRTENPMRVPHSEGQRRQGVTQKHRAATLAAQTWIESTASMKHPQTKECTWQ